MSGTRFCLESVAGAQVAYDNIEYLAHKQATGRTVDAFEDLQLSSNPTWTVTGNWSVTNGTAYSGTESTTRELVLPVTNGDAEYWFRYSVAVYRARILLRCNAAKTSFLALDMATDNLRIQQNNNGVWTTLDQDWTVTSPVGTWYDLYVKTKGSTIEVWRGLSGQAMTKVAESTACAVLSGTQLDFIHSAGHGAYYDDFAFVTSPSTGNSFTDDFTDGNYTANPAWTIGDGTWSAASNYMRNTAQPSGYPRFIRNVPFQHAQIKFSYLKEDVNQTNFEWRDAANRRFALFLESGRMKLSQVLDGVTWTTLATNTGAGSTANQWYDVQVVMDRGKVEVWRRAQGASAYTHIFTVTNNEVTESARVTFQSSPNSVIRFDNIDIAVDDPSLTLYTYKTTRTSCCGCHSVAVSVRDGCCSRRRLPRRSGTRSSQ